MIANLNHGDAQRLIAACKSEGLLRNQTAYLLATAHLETGGTLKPVRETFADSDEEAIRILESSWRRGRLKWVKTPYWRRDARGRTFLGRGYSQITHFANYMRLGRRIGVDLTSDPNVVMQPSIAARIIVLGMKEGLFTGRRLDQYLTLASSNFEGARRIINGTDRAQEIAALAEAYDKALKAAGYGEAEEQRPTTRPQARPTAPGFFAALAAFLKGSQA